MPNKSKRSYYFMSLRRLHITILFPSVLLFFIGVENQGYAQLPNCDILVTIDSVSAQHFYLDIDANAYLRDAEYFLPYTKGYTIAGFRISPTLRYHINDRVAIRGGAMMTSVADVDGRFQIRPILSFDYQACSWLRMVMGTLYGSNNHHLGEPLYDRERWFYDYKEDGLQILTKTAHWESDTWLNWEQFLEPWTAEQERFTLGTRHNLQLLETHNSNYLMMTASFVGSHRGGQFSTLDTCIETLFNENVGLRWETRCLDGSFIALNAPVYFFQNMSPEGERYTPFTNGWGVHPNLQIQDNNLFASKKSQSKLYLQLGYWYGDSYISPRGSYLFQSVSWHNPDFSQKIRHLFTSDIAFEHEYKDFILNLNAQFYYDPDHKSLDLAIGVLMHWKGGFRIF